jgi:prevent-host-death family protein
MADTFSTVQARDQFSEVLNRAAFGKERVVLTRRGKPLVAIVPIEDLALLEELEDQRDAEDFRIALAAWEAGDQTTIPLDQVVRELGIQL